MLLFISLRAFEQFYTASYSFQPSDLFSSLQQTEEESFEEEEAAEEEETTTITPSGLNQSQIIGLAVGIPAAVIVVGGATTAAVMIQRKKKGKKLAGENMAEPYVDNVLQDAK